MSSPEKHIFEADFPDIWEDRKRSVQKTDEGTAIVGMKFDDAKPLMSLLSPWFTEDIAKVLTIGAKKYAVDNWKIVPNARQRYSDALLRHINAYLKGEQNDPETGLPHLCHAACNLMFLYEFDRELQVNESCSSLPS